MRVRALAHPTLPLHTLSHAHPRAHGRSIAAPHLDPLVTKAMKFLVSAVSQPARARLFADPATLRAILEKVVVPNILLRDTGERRRGRQGVTASGGAGSS